MKTKLNLVAAGLFLAGLGTGLGQLVITQQPQSCTTVVGTTATFTVQATGTEPLVHQWQKLSGNWSDMAGRTDTNLVLTNVQSSHAGDYRVVVTNADGAVTSQVAKLTVVLPPSAFIKSLAPYQRMAVYLGSTTSLTITASGTPTLSFQWRLEGSDLPGKTNQTLTIATAQLADEGNYTVVVTNPWSSATSAPARLYVTPPSAQMIRRDFTNAAHLRLPYWYLLPDNYNPSLSYPLVCVLHGNPGGETYFQTYADIGPQAIGLVFASYKQQRDNPAIVVWPARRVGDSEWTAQYLQQVLGLVDRLVSEFNVDTNRLYISGMSEGVHAVWDCLGSRPGFFAGATVLAGWQGSSSTLSIKGVPLWAFCAKDDSLVEGTRSLVRALRLAGGNPVYTEHNAGGHIDGIAMGLCTPAAVNWMLAQRRGNASTNEPLLSITLPTCEVFHATGATNLCLSGSAAALDSDVTQVTWTNFANNANGVAPGKNLWSVTGIPLVANKTNVIVVVGTTTSWAPAFGGNTTFNDALAVIQSPLRATLTWEGSEALLKWSGGGPPYRVQRATDLAAGDWTVFLNDATPPVLLPLTGQAGFYRILGQ